MQIDIGWLRDSKGASLSATGRIALGGDLGTGLTAKDPASVSAVLTNMGRYLHVEGTVEAALQAECVRCLAPFNFTMSIPFVQDYVYSISREAEDEIDDMRPLSGDQLILDEAAGEALLLALPMKTLCREDCPGLCPVCGQRLAEKTCQCAPAQGHPGLADLAHLLPKKEV